MLIESDGADSVMGTLAEAVPTTGLPSSSVPLAVMTSVAVSPALPLTVAGNEQM